MTILYDHLTNLTKIRNKNMCWIKDTKMTKIKTKRV